MHDIDLLKIVDNLEHEPCDTRECATAVNATKMLEHGGASQTEPQRRPLTIIVISLANLALLSKR